MEQRKVCVELEQAWDAVSAKWAAYAKVQYQSRIFDALREEADGMYRRNEELERYAETCKDSFRYLMGDEAK